MTFPTSHRTPASRAGNVIVIAIVLLGFLAAAVFAFLTQIVKSEDTNHYSTALLMARQAALAGRAQALESILKDYGEVGTWVKQANNPAGTPSWAQVPGVRLTRASGEWRQAFLPFAAPYAVRNIDWKYGEGTQLENSVGSDQRLDIARDCMWNITSAGNNGWDDNPAYYLGATLTTGRARYYEPEYYQLDQLHRATLPLNSSGGPVRDDYIEPSATTDGDIQTQQFNDRTTILVPGTGVRGNAGYYDARWNPVPGTTAQQRQIARYRLRYSVMVDELDSHLRINATGRDLPTGAQINETDPNDPTNCAVVNPYDPLAADTLKRKIVRYAPAMFNLGFASQPYKSSGDSACPTPIILGSVLEHIFMGRGQGVDMMRLNDGFPRTWPLMYRHGLLGSWGTDYPHPNYFHAGSNGNAYTLPTHLYTDGMKAINESKYGGFLVGLSTAVVWGGLQNPWFSPFEYFPFQTMWAGSMTGRMQTPDSVYMAIGRSMPGEHAERQWSTNFPSPWGRGLELRNPANPRDPTQRYQADVDTPFHVNLLSAPRLAIHALITAYLPRQAKSLRVASVTYTQNAVTTGPNQSPAITQTNYFANPLEPISAPVFSRDLFIDKLWATSEGGPTPFSFPAPSRVVSDGTISPDWYSPDWTLRVGNSAYPGGTLCMDIPLPTVDATLDDTGRLIRTDDGYTDYIPTGAGRTDETAGGLWGQALDPETGQPWLILPTNYTVTAPDYPPGWGVDPGAITSSTNTSATFPSGVPIEQTITNWLATGPTPTSTQTWVDANKTPHSYTTSSTTAYLCSATVNYSQDPVSGFGQLMATQQSIWGDVAAAFMSAVTVVRAQWTQRPGGCFDPWFDNTPGDASTIARVGGNADYTGSGGWNDRSMRWVIDHKGNKVAGNLEFRKAWDPKSYATLGDFDRVFLQQLGIDINNPAAATVANGWLINRYTRGAGGSGMIGTAPVMTIVPPTAATGTWNAGFNLRTLAGNPTSNDPGVVGTPQWQRLQEIAMNWNALYPVGDAPPIGWWTATPKGPAQSWWSATASAQANINGYVAHYQTNFGLIFAKTGDGQIMSSRLRSAAMEEVINDFRYSMWGSSPAYAGTFHPLDLNGDGLVNCSAYPANNTATPQEQKYHLDHFVPADANGQGPVIDPAAGHTPFCIGGNLFMGKSRFYRITVRGEVWDNVNDRMFSTALNDSVVCVDTGSADQPADMRSGHTLYQRWIWEQERPQQDAPPPSPP